jgi:hypothetical protein
MTAEQIEAEVLFLLTHNPGYFGPARLVEEVHYTWRVPEPDVGRAIRVLLDRKVIRLTDGWRMEVVGASPAEMIGVVNEGDENDG